MVYQTVKKCMTWEYYFLGIFSTPTLHAITQNIILTSLHVAQTNIELHCELLIILLIMLIFYNIVSLLMIVGEVKKQVDTSPMINIIVERNYDWVLTLLHSSPFLLTNIEPFLTQQYYGT